MGSPHLTEVVVAQKAIPLLTLSMKDIAYAACNALVFGGLGAE